MVDIFPIPLLSVKGSKDVNFGDLSFALVSMDFALSFSHRVKSISLSNWMIQLKQAMNFWTTTLENSLKNIKSQCLIM